VRGFAVVNSIEWPEWIRRQEQPADATPADRMVGDMAETLRELVRAIDATRDDGRQADSPGAALARHMRKVTIGAVSAIIAQVSRLAERNADAVVAAIRAVSTDPAYARQQPGMVDAMAANVILKRHSKPVTIATLAAVLARRAVEAEQAAAATPAPSGPAPQTIAEALSALRQRRAVHADGDENAEPTWVREAVGRILDDAIADLERCAAEHAGGSQ
jgi:hypothetical protein